jgi:hypothetical protein
MSEEKCPLCGKTLYNPYGTNQSCPTKHGGWGSHYWLYSDGTETIYIDRFRVISKRNNTMVVFNNGSGDCYKEIVCVPAFEIKSEEQLLNKIKTLVVFS